MNIEIANRLLQLRKANNLSQEELAAKLGVSRQAVSKWERAEASPDTDKLMALSKIYNISLDELLKSDEQYNYDYIAEESLDKEEKFDEEVYVSNDETVHKEEEKKETSKKVNSWDWISFPVFITILYIVLGFLFRCWHPAWILFLTIPLYETVVPMIKMGKSNKEILIAFPYPVLVTMLYLAGGFLFKWWHPGWILFLTIPLYYCWVETLDKH